MRTAVRAGLIASSRRRSPGLVRHVGSGQSFATVQAALAASATGDLIYVHAGSYAQQTITDTHRGGVATVKPFPGDTVTVQGFLVNGGSYVNFDGFATTGENRVQSAAHHVTWRNGVASCQNTTTNCFYVAAGLCHDVLVTDNVCSAPHQCGFQSNGGTDPAQWSYNVTFTRNTVSGSNQDCCFVDGLKTSALTYNTLRDTQQNLNHNDGVQVTSCDTLTVGWNHVYRTTPAATTQQYGTGIIIEHANGNTDTTRLVQNIIAVANLIHGWHGTGLMLDGTINSWTINNTVYDCWGEDSEPGGDGVALGLDATADFVNEGTFEVWNNIVERCYRGGGNLPTFADRNHFGDATWEHFGTNQTTGDPLFADGAYHLQAGSSCKDSGLSGRSNTPSTDVYGTAYGTMDRGAVAA